MRLQGKSVQRKYKNQFCIRSFFGKLTRQNRQFNNANNIVLTGNAANLPFTRQGALSSDPISGLGRLLSPKVFVNRPETDFTLKTISPGGNQPATPYSGEPGLGYEIIRDLFEYH